MDPETEARRPDHQHFPAFDKLCEMAEEAGLQVRLPVSTDVQFGQWRGEEYRQITRIELWEMHLPGVGGLQRYGGKPAMAAPVYDDDLEAAALDLLARP